MLLSAIVLLLSVMTLVIPFVVFVPLRVITQAACAPCGVNVMVPVAGVDNEMSKLVSILVVVERLGKTYESSL